MLPRFPDTGLLPHPVGWAGFKERRREALYKEKSKCSGLKGSKSTAVKLRILKRFSFDSPNVRDGQGHTSFKPLIAWNKQSYSLMKIMKIPSTKKQISNNYQ